MNISQSEHRFVLTIAPPVTEQQNIQKKEVRHLLTLATPVATGTKDYNVLINKPSINDVVLQGNLSLSDLGIQDFTLYRYMGNVATVADLDNVQNPENGDVYHVESDGYDYCWNESESRWENLGNFIQIQSLTNEEIDAIISSVEGDG